MINQSKLKEHLHYEPTTGTFTWIKKLTSRTKVGSIAGYKHYKGYLQITFKDEKYYLHRLAWLYMTGDMPIKQIDHINRIKTDNRYFNLREVSSQENHRNLPKRKDNTSGTTGVSWEKITSKWRASIHISGKKIYLGCYAELKDAIEARKEANIKYKFHVNHGK